MARNSNYYKNKMLLAKQKEVGRALLVEDDHWLDVADEEKDEKEAHAHICFMAKITEDDNSDDDDRTSCHS